ncbi:hypothetical protein VC83_00293 [Pseudogymnoascus destructans]|uniref:AAA+ ATPase domain-containing protein n=2 Tax=Pseudogymnoascus destructans TaxID=655981 RepID=L8FTG0_PSED2|nr:uncharacterized protein VC83_00293 [Pseudogymnoascus destructans]ELR04240.1 hypothetical protein GMDG_06648 [Pseudogymnoascus destructans 20631-21]OAF63335.1 hypothetical protein VC83_00293 [Pseudogymnoascus destructans]
MPVKRKLEHFDPNKSDSNDDDYESGPERRTSRKSVGRSKSKGGASAKKKKRAKYRGSDVDDDDDDLTDDSLLDQSFDEEAEEPERTETGRPLRGAVKKSVKYEESESDAEDAATDNNDDDEDISRPNTRSPKKMVITLKVKTPVPSSKRTTRAGSVRASAEPTTAANRPRRNTRAHTEEVDEGLVALSNSGRHAVVQGSSPTPENSKALRPMRGGKGLKMPAGETILEASHESTLPEEEEGWGGDGEAIEVDEETKGDIEIGDSHATKDDTQAFSEKDEGTGDLVAELTTAAAAGDGANDEEDDDEDDELPVSRTRVNRTSVSQTLTNIGQTVKETVEGEPSTPPGGRRLRKRTQPQKAGLEQTSDFEPNEESEEDISASDVSPRKRKGSDNDTDSTPRRGRGAHGKSKSSRSRRRDDSDGDSEALDADELLEEAAELKANGRRRPRPRRDPEILYESMGRRERKRVDYTIKPMDQIYAADEDLEDAAPVASGRTKRNAGSQAKWERTLHTTYGPFGGGGGPTPVTGPGPWGTGAAGGADSDSSDDENLARPTGVAGNVGMTPTTGMPAGLLPGLGQANPTEPMAAVGGTPNNLGKIKSQKALADADPLGVDQNVDFSKVGGLAGHIDQLKEMVQMPLLYPELFLKFHVTPPRGVLFHGPPGTGKTLLARALAASVGSGGRKITFYMRKGADALSKWVGEAERQLRLLFEEARKTQPSIIFFDEIDGLAPVRSSKQEQIHASIVSTLLALMDGMDGRGQVIVIGATNRPDNIDPALRRPGRFDREFYFPLPDIEGRRSIIDIHTRDWGVDDKFKDSLSHVTKGYGGADLRALCTEAALNAIQRTYPQIYSSNDKLIVDPDKIKITAKDFMLSIKKMVPSSERATSSGAAPLPKAVEPLLRDQLKSIEVLLDGLIPIKKKTTALQEALYEQYEDADSGFGRETLAQDFEKARVFRPRLLIGGGPGMGQGYLGSALLNHFEGLHVQSFDLPTIYSDSARSAETAIVQLFAEVKRHKPSVIFLPGVDTWYHTLSDSAITTFLGLLRGIPPTDPVLVLGICDAEPDQASPEMIRDLFGFTKKNRFLIARPSRRNREDFFKNIIEYIKKQPTDFPDPVNRKLRKLDTLAIAPPPPPRIPTKEETKALKQRDRQTLNTLKVMIQPIMDQIQKKYRKFRNPAVPQSVIQYLYDEQDPNYVRPDVVQFRPYELDTDKDGVSGLRDSATGKFFYNLETTTIEERLSNGFYARPKDFVADIRRLAKDMKNTGDQERALRGKELLANVEVDLALIEANPVVADCENVYQRQLQRVKEKAEKYRKRAEEEAILVGSDIPAEGSREEPIVLGMPTPKSRAPGLFSTPTSLSNGTATHSSLSSEQRLSNGSSLPSTRHSGGDDVAMGGTDEASQIDSQNMPPPPATTGGSLFRSRTSMPSALNTQGSQFSQRSAFQSLPHDVSPTALFNDASTTTSGRKTEQSSGDKSTQLTNGHGGSQQYSSHLHGHGEGDSQLPDTQSQDWVHSQVHGRPPTASSASVSHSTSTPSQPGGASAPTPAYPSIHAGSDQDLASTAGEPSQVVSVAASSQKEVIIDEVYLAQLLEMFVSRTDGWGVEDLEMAYREMMECLWKGRGEWNRSRVGVEVANVFGEVVGEVEGRV